MLETAGARRKGGYDVVVGVARHHHCRKSHRPDRRVFTIRLPVPAASLKLDTAA
jgi:hypothetical protein